MAFFQDVKKYNLKVLFRTMHEMNGGRYARSSDPDNFKKAWKRVFTLSRKAELGSENIQFIFSFNWHDMPINKEQERRKKNSAFGPASEGDITPNQSSSLITCTPAKKKDTGCFTWEDYYPGDGWVDLIGFTAYNRGKATSNRRWVSFWDIINDPVWNNWQRIRTMGKPIYIDEVGTSAVKYNESFNWARSQEKYSRMTQPKNERLYDLA
jgi:beta-mannanase